MIYVSETFSGLRLDQLWVDAAAILLGWKFHLFIVWLVNWLSLC